VLEILVNVGVDNEDVLVAGVLHDTVEDTGVSFEDIGSNFGSHVESILREVTDDKSLPKRKRLQIEHAGKCSLGAKLVKLADKIANIREITPTIPDGWTLERKLEYIERSYKVVGAMVCRGPAMHVVGLSLFTQFCEEKAKALALFGK
jgi:guanosine-3',5'-bis(diphosphate) 3'-pyrophosphohydrolase